MRRICLALLLLSCLAGGFARGADENASAILENEALRISLSPQDASFSVTDKRIGLVWPQQVTPGFRVVADSLKRTPGSLSAEVAGPGGPYSITLTLAPDRPHGIDVALDLPGRKYTAPPPYPFPFAAPADGWFYVQNTTGEGMLLPLEKPGEIKKPFEWSGGQPWWGLTDLQRAMSARLDSFRSQAANATVYAVPLRIHYEFFPEGGYRRLAKEYRHWFLRSNAGMKTLAERVEARPAVAGLKDGVYVYLWGENPAEDLSLVREMKAAGVERGIAVFYGRHEIDRALFDGIKQLGWVAGMYACRPAICSRSRGGGAGPRTCCSGESRLIGSWPAAISRAGTASVPGTSCPSGRRRPRD